MIDYASLLNLGGENAPHEARKRPEFEKKGGPNSRPYTHGFTTYATFLFAAGCYLSRSSVASHAALQAACIIVGMGALRRLSLRVAWHAYTRQTGWHEWEDNVGFSKAGGIDIANWSSIAGLAMVLGLSTLVDLPVGFFGRLLSQATGAMLAAAAIAAVISRLTFEALFGPRDEKGSAS